MIHYPHFAFKNIYLINGYSEEVTPEGRVIFYQEEDELENSIRLMLIEKKGSLSGWDFRFLRRGLKMSQGDIANYLGKDAQTIARLEKSNEKIPMPFDLTIRTLCAGKYCLQLKAYDLLRFIGAEANSDEKIYFSYSGRWIHNSLYSLKPVMYSDVSTALIQLPKVNKRADVYWRRPTPGRVITIKMPELGQSEDFICANEGFTTIHKQLPISPKRTVISEQYSLQ